jgi:hypothetical protein
MPAIGDSFFFDVPGAHLWMVITEPDGADGEFVMVNITTDHTGEGACGLYPEDDNGNFITRPSDVRYKDAQLWREVGPKGYNALLAAGMIRPYGQLKPETLIKVQDGAFIAELFSYFDKLRDHLVNPITGENDIRIRARRELGLPC